MPNIPKESIGKFTCIWKGMKPSEEEIKQIVEDHEFWLKEEYPDKKYWVKPTNEPPHDLSGATLEGIEFKQVNFARISLAGAELKNANLAEANLQHANLEDANIDHANLEDVNLWQTKLVSARLIGANLTGAIIVDSNLTGAALGHANLKWANLYEATVVDARIFKTNLKGTDLSNTDLSNTDVYGVSYDHRMKCLGIKADTCYGSPMFKRHVQDLAYLEEFQEKHPRLHWAWGFFADFGFGVSTWIAWSVFLIFVFAFIMGAGHCLGWFEFLEKIQKISPMVVLYYSVVTFTTLGFGDIVPLNAPAQILVIIMVLFGYVWLGGLIALMGQFLTRRSQ